MGQGPDCPISHSLCPNPLVWLVRVTARKQLQKRSQCDSWTTQSGCSLQLPVSPCGLTPWASTAGSQVSPAWPSPAHHTAQHYDSQKSNAELDTCSRSHGASMWGSYPIFTATHSWSHGGYNESGHDSGAHIWKLYFSNPGQIFLHAKWYNFQHYVVLLRETQGERDLHCADVPLLSSIFFSVICRER